MNKKLSVAVIGLGYFSQFHLKAWRELDSVKRIHVTDLDQERVRWAENSFDAVGHSDVDTLFHGAAVDVVDIIAPPSAHLELIRKVAHANRTIICQKPFCTSIEEAEKAIALAEAHGARLVIHENFRFQPWYRAIKTILDDGQLGQIYQCRFALRPGDGQGADAYLARQPSFRGMPRFLVQETGVHFIDLFRWLFGDISDVYADLRQLNPAIKGEDAGTLVFNHANGVQSIFDGNRLADHATDNPRRTMGEMTIEGENAVLFLDGSGQLHVRKHGAQQSQSVASVEFDETTFGGGCVKALITHVVEALLGDAAMENTAKDYLPVLHICEAAYRSAQQGQKISLPESEAR